MYKFSIVNELIETRKNWNTDDCPYLENNRFTCFQFMEKREGYGGNSYYAPINNSPVCGITLTGAGSMRFRWDEVNETRNKTLWNIASTFENTEHNYSYMPDLFTGYGEHGEYKPGCNPDVLTKKFIPVQLDHTKIVYKVNSQADTRGKIGDGIITDNAELIPTITVADCVPIYLYDKGSGAFGIVHSGWKGTGIAVEAIKLAMKEYGTKIEDVFVVIGPHIHSCCYIVNEERAEYFRKNFTPDCVMPVKPGSKIPGTWNNGSGPLYRLSLTEANVSLLEKFGVPDSNISVCTDCTCCHHIGQQRLFGSNRRETTESGQPDKFTVMAAFISKK